jgi:DNA-binding NarL/FixJ family response regulator
LPARRRILVLGSSFLRSLVREIVAGAEDLEICSEVDATELDIDSALCDAAAQSDADFVIVALGDRSLDPVYLRLLEERPRAKVLAVAGDGRTAWLWELRPRRTLLGEISPESLLGAIRSTAWRSAPVG